MSLRAFLSVGLMAGLGLACSQVQPPAAERAPSSVVVVAEPGASDASEDARASGEVRESVLGTVQDNLPFKPTGKKLASIAWRTWVYTDTGPQRTRYGYLRAGAVVDVRGPEIKNSGCQGGWYRVNPRGFVCVGKGATLDLSHEIVTQAAVRPERGKGLPYLYAMSTERPPHQYFRLPSVEEVMVVEGRDTLADVITWREKAKRLGWRELLGDPEPPPQFLKDVRKLNKPYGVKTGLHYSVHAGQASPDAGFALQRTFVWEDREYGLSTELDVLALDRLEIVKPTAFHGVRLEEGEGLPVAFADQGPSRRYTRAETGGMLPGEVVAHRAGIKLTGQRAPNGFLETRNGDFVPQVGLRLIQPRDSFPSFATGDRKWIDISIRSQTLVAYVGRRPVYATLVSTGRGGLADPEKSFATVRGTFMIHHKAVSSTMDGDDDKSDSFNLLDVPFVQYFHKGYALHGTYWHDEFGRERSHGCVNLAPQDAAWLFEWTDPQVPSDWHATLNKERGTVVYIHA
ncbi:MAG TPA: L,D-transpeptidase [Polyangiaceae bacterium]|nr:L,D-transpeptidase [Polyangiaceae bacterium]